MWRKAFACGIAVAACGLAVVAESATPLPSIPSAKAPKSLLLDVVAVGKRLVAVGERGHILLSDDGGKTWRQPAVPVRSLLTAVYFVDDKQGWAVGHDSVVLHTPDGGENWALQNYKEYSPESAAAMAEEEFVDESMDDAAYDESFEEDTGRAIGSREGVPLLDVWFADASRGVAVGAYGLMLQTADGGKTWTDASDTISNPEGWHFNAIAGHPASGVVVIAGEKGTFYRSVDAGRSFSPSRSPYDGSFFGAAVGADGAFYVFGLQGSLFRSADQGVGWTSLATGVTSGLNDACSTADGRLLVTGNAGVLLTVTADGKTVTTERRPDRQAVLSCARAGNEIVLVGDGGVKPLAAMPVKP